MIELVELILRGDANAIERHAWLRGPHAEAHRDRLPVLLDLRLLRFDRFAGFIEQLRNDRAAAVTGGGDLGGQRDRGVFKIGLRYGDAADTDVIRRAFAA